MSPSLVSVPEAAKQFNCSTRTIRRYIADGRLTGYRIGPRMLRVDRAELDRLPALVGGGAL